jgi:hypothetical protein
MSTTAEKMEKEKVHTAAAKESASAKLERMLGYGRFQKFQVYTFAGILSVIGAFDMFQLIFTVTRKPFRCSLPDAVEKRCRAKLNLSCASS